MTPRTAFLITTVIGVLWACYGIFQPTWMELGTGTVIAAVGVMGYEFCRFER